MDCLICAESFNRSNHKLTECHHCFFKACQECVGTFLLSKDHAECMNCHKLWDYVFLSSQMTKKFLQKQYKQHVKNILMRDIETGLGDYQEIAATTNEKEKVAREMHQVRDRLNFLEDQEINHVKVHVVMDQYTFQLYHYICDKQTPKSRYATLIIRYIEDLVNPPPTDLDNELARNEEKKLKKKVHHEHFMMMGFILDKNVCSDKLHYALSPPPLEGESFENLKMQIENKKKESKILYEQFIEDREKTQSLMFQWLEDVRRLYGKFWGQYFRHTPATPENIDQIKKEKIRLSTYVEESRQKLLDAIWEKDDVFHRFHSTKKYIYNLDDQRLYPLHGETVDVNVLEILKKEENRWSTLAQAHQEEITHLLPIYQDLQEKHRTLDKKLRLLNKNKTVSGNYILNCPKEDCLGKLGDDGRCGLCQHSFCDSCMKEKTKGHECQKEDVETVKELKSSTRPCPKCYILIYKIEGCDQMWCVKCHTTFSWKSGAISHGIIHNPHFYQDRQQALRTPGDIPCGGLPNEVEMMTAIVQSVEDRTAMYDIWDYCDRVAEKLMPRIYEKFHNVRPIKYRRFSISYMRGKINKKQLESSLFRNYMDEIRYAHYYGLLETFVDNMAEYMRQFVNGLNRERECRTLLQLFEQDLQQMNKTFHMKEVFHSPV